MRKGDLVKLNVNKCFTVAYGGKRTFPLGNGHEDENGYVRAGRPTTDAERRKWREDLNAEIAAAPQEERFAIACDSAGESRLAPRSVTVNVPRDVVLVLERARCRVALGWGNPTPGMAKVMLPNGETAYLKRDLLEVA